MVQKVRVNYTAFEGLNKHTLQLQLNSCFPNLFLFAGEKTRNEILYSKMSMQHILSDNTSGTVGVMKRHQGTAAFTFSFVLLNKQLLGNTGVTAGSRLGSSKKKELQQPSLLLE